MLARSDIHDEHSEQQADCVADPWRCLCQWYAERLVRAQRQKFSEPRGIAWLSLDYPIANGNPVEAETEAERVVAALKSDGHAVYAFGWSTGATIALWLAIHDRVVAAAAMAGPTDLRAWNRRLKASGWTKANADAASPLLHLPKSEAIAPILVLHSLDDSIVPYSYTTNVVATASTKGIAPQPQVITYSAGNHAIINLSAPNADAGGWLVSLISGSGPSTTTTTTSTSSTSVPELDDSTTAGAV